MSPLVPFYDDVGMSDRKEPSTGMELMYIKQWGKWEKLFSMDPIDYYEIIYPLDKDLLLGRNLKDLQEWFKDLEELNPEFDEISFEETSWRVGCSEYEHRFYVVGKRKETEEETKTRIEKLQKKAKERQDLQLAKEDEKTQKERKEYERLQKKYGSN